MERFLQRVKDGERVSFAETQSLIRQNYQYTAVEFSTGLGNDRIKNDVGVNEGSCRIFSFARLHGLDEQATLSLFGEYYWIDVLDNPQKDNHRNIRNFIKYGWKGVWFSAPALTPQVPG